MRVSGENADSLYQDYRQRYENVLSPLACSLRDHVANVLDGQERIDRVVARAKDVNSFVAKAKIMVNGIPKYPEPLSQIQDQIGVRIITFYLDDVERLAKYILEYFCPIEERDHIPESEWEFGYFGKHFILLLPRDVVDMQWNKNFVPRVFELQIKTLFQHAWAEAGHDLGYKPGKRPLTAEQKRELAFTSAQAWGADHIFDKLFRERAGS